MTCMTTTARLDTAQAAVLAALAPGGILSVHSLEKSTQQTTRRVRNAVMQLQQRGLIMLGYRGLEITDRGRHTLSTACGG